MGERVWGWRCASDECRILFDGALWHSSNSLILPLRKPKTCEPNNIFNDYRPNTAIMIATLVWDANLHTAMAHSWLWSTEMHHTAFRVDWDWTSVVIDHKILADGRKRSFKYHQGPFIDTYIASHQLCGKKVAPMGWFLIIGGQCI